MIYIIHFLITAAAIYFFAGSGIVDGISFTNWYISAILFAVVLAVVNLILGTVLRIVSFPLRLITLGLFSFVISAVVIYVTDQLVPSVTIVGIPALLALAVVLSVTSFVLRIFK
jgi:putative membrane protein